MTYQAPKTIGTVLRQINFNVSLAADDPRIVETAEARGSDKMYSRFLRKLGLSQGEFLPSGSAHILFFGHTGVGKSTELRRYAAAAKATGHLYPVEIDVPAVLDKNNLQYADTLLAMAQAMLKAIEDEHLQLPRDALQPLEKWFGDRVHEETQLRDFQASVEAGASVRSGIPLLLELVAKMTSSVRVNSTYKETIRTQTRKHFSSLATAFNNLLEQLEDALTQRASKHVRVVFIIDGTDKLSEEDTKRFFVADANQLVDIHTLAVYTAPISLKYEGLLHASLETDLVLPMIKLQDQEGRRFDIGWDCLRDMLLRRADRSVFAEEATIDRLVEMSGGHPREMLRLLKYACEAADGDKLDAAAVENAVKTLASEYRYFLASEDYALLATADAGREQDGNEGRVGDLLLRCALLQYNDGSWRRSHPVVRLLSGYLRAKQQLAPQQGY